MERTELPKDHGMFFVFETQQVLHFWLKNTLIPLDIFFFDADGNFVSMATMEPLQSGPLEAIHRRRKSDMPLKSTRA